jgi:hypothetical protein
MDKISNNSACVIGVIALIAVIPRYIQLPKSLELLFHDMIGQLLLLLLAITVGSYNFTCGVLLVVLFLSIMLQSKRGSVSEGFIDYEEGEDKDMELNENFDTATKKTKKTSNMEEEDKTKDMEEEDKTKDMEDIEEKPMPTKKPVKITKDTSVVDNLKQELQASQKKIKALESRMNNALRSSNNSNKNMESENEPEMDMETEATSEPTVEGFECGCTNDSRRKKFVKYQEAQGLIETFEDQPPQQTPKVEKDCYDLAGCKYQNGYTPFNDTFHGPPVDSCHAYRKANINATGTLFYPLN